MKFSAVLLALATTALGNQVEERWGHLKETTLTTYTTLTTCPVTSTYTSQGSTYEVTKLTTSTITVTECHGCAAQVTTVPGPVKTLGTTTEVEITYTTVCPVTKTVTGPSHTYLTTFTTTSTVVTHIPTTFYSSVPGPKVTKTAVDTEYSTLTSLCPVTKTTTIGGKETTITYTTTQIIKSNALTTIYETEQAPGKTKTALETDFVTYTSLCPVTKTTTIGGKETTVTYTTTQVIKSNALTTIYETEQAPGKTKTALETDYVTYTSLCPVTETKTIGGKETTVTYTTTQIIKSNALTTIYETQKAPDTTKVAVETEYSTYTSLCPVTETKTIGGKVQTITYTTTSIIKAHLPTTLHQTKQLPGVTKTEVEVEYSTQTSLCPVTETQTINGEKVTKVYTSTQIIVTKVPVVVKETQFLPGATETSFEVQHSTLTKLIPTTETKIVNGKEVTKVYTATKVVVTEIPTTIEAVQTIYHTASNKEVQTKYSKVFITVGGGTIVRTLPAAPTTVLFPETSVVSAPPVIVTSTQQAPPPPPPATSAPVEVPTGAAQANQAPAVALMAGVVGALALF